MQIFFAKRHLILKFAGIINILLTAGMFNRLKEQNGRSSQQEKQTRSKKFTLGCAIESTCIRISLKIRHMTGIYVVFVKVFTIVIVIQIAIKVHLVGSEFM